MCVAVVPKDGTARTELIDRRPTGLGTQWLADWLNARYSKASCVVIDGKNGVDVLTDKIAETWKAKNSVIRPSAKDVIAAVSTIVDALNEKTITWYAAQDDLRESAISSSKRPIGGGWGFGGENSAPIEACALALYGAKISKSKPHKHTMAVSSKWSGRRPFKPQMRGSSPPIATNLPALITLEIPAAE